MKHKHVMILTAAMAILTGCSGETAPAFAPAESSLYITGEGAVTSAVVETYENDYYSAEELKAFAEEILADFHGGEETKAVLKECTMADGTAKLLIEFKDADAYLDFMDEYPDEESEIRVRDLDVVTVTEGVTKGYLVGKTFTKVSGEAKTVNADEVMKQSKLYVAAVDGAALIQTDGMIQYISEGVSIAGNNMIQTPENEISYVVFK